MSHTETELKLELSPADLTRLKRAKTVQTLKTGRPVSKAMSSVYYDTPGFDLYRADTVLRVRQVGRTFKQTAKTGGDRSAGLFIRAEVEHPLGGPEPDLSLLRGTPLEGMIAHASEPLEPIFTTETRRSTYILKDDAFEATLDIDDGKVVNGHGTLDLCEAELELVSGQPARLYDLALDLLESVPMRVSTASKSDKGYAMAIQSRPTPVTAPPIRLRKKHSIEDAFAEVARGCLGHFLANEDAVRDGGDREGLHQMRVALRRLKSAMTLHKAMLDTPQTAAVREDVRWLGGALGPARDLDVFVAELLRPVADAHPDDANLQALLKAFDTRRKAAYTRAVKAVEDPRFTRLVLRLGGWIEGGDWRAPDDEAARALLAIPARDYARALLTKRHKKVIKAGHHFRHLAPEELHALRIQIKKLRYAAGFFQSLFDKKAAKTYGKHLGALQDGLGVLNDVRVAHGYLDPYRQGDKGPDLAWAAGMVIGHHATRIGDIHADLADTWKAVAKSRPFWL